MLRRLLFALLVLSLLACRDIDTVATRSPIATRDPQVRGLSPTPEARQLWEATTLWDATVLWRATEAFNAAVAENERRSAQRTIEATKRAPITQTPRSTTTTSGTVPRSTSGVDWDAIAACESGGDWHIYNPPYSGGLQFMASTWTGYGGREFASMAYQASREQQIAVAERVLAGQGIGAWPVCGRRG